uniref:Uncharacterized protein n=1 Tax=Cucumis melo TaxID=3656 RepID=A0A9I9EEQ2_CUCME
MLWWMRIVQFLFHRSKGSTKCPRKWTLRNLVRIWPHSHPYQFKLLKLHYDSYYEWLNIWGQKFKSAHHLTYLGSEENVA